MYLKFDIKISITLEFHYNHLQCFDPFKSKKKATVNFQQNGKHACIFHTYSNKKVQFLIHEKNQPNA